MKRIVPDGCARILVKFESVNPTGSMKDRMALAMIEAGKRSGRLKPGQRVVEYTGGSTDVSLALKSRTPANNVSRHDPALGAFTPVVPAFCTRVPIASRHWTGTTPVSSLFDRSFLGMSAPSIP